MSPSDITTIKKTVGIQNQKKSTNAKQTKKKIFTQKSVGKGGLVGEQLKFFGGVYKTLKATR